MFFMMSLPIRKPHNGWRYPLVGGTRLAVETEKHKATKKAKKRRAYPPVHCASRSIPERSEWGCVSLHFSFK
jgi:hypothetical protein